MTNEIRNASTVALCKITTKWPFKILLLKRSEKAAFLPGAFVFPGGRLEQADYEFGDFLGLDQQNTFRISEYFPAQRSVVLAHLAAGIRECLEETDISILRLLSINDTKPCNSSVLQQLIADKDFRARCNDLPSLSNLWPISWWITPEGEARRYNTWFFLGLVDESCIATNRDPEISESLWLDPQEALLRFTAGQLFLAPPTRTILERMAQTKSLEEFLSHVDKPLIPIAPYFVDHEGQKMLVLPGDPLHHEPTRAKMPVKTRYSFSY